MIKVYNSFIKGVDKADENIDKYCSSFGKKNGIQALYCIVLN